LIKKRIQPRVAEALAVAQKIKKKISCQPTGYPTPAFFSGLRAFWSVVNNESTVFPYVIANPAGRHVRVGPSPRLRPPERVKQSQTFHSFALMPGLLRWCGYSR